MAITVNSSLTQTGVTQQEVTNAIGFTPKTSNPLSVFAVGSVYNLTNAAAAVTFGTTSPALTLNAPGTYLLIARAKMMYTGATFAATQTITTKLRRTNNTAADIANGTITSLASIITTITGLCSDQCWQTVYTTTASDDSIAIYSQVAAVPSAGNLQCTEASIIAIRLQ